VKIPQQVQMALRNNLVGEALKLLTDMGTDLGREYGSDAFESVLVRIALELVTGRIEDAALDLNDAPILLERTSEPEKTKLVQKALLHAMAYQKLVFEGNLMAAGEILQYQGRTPLERSSPLVCGSRAETTSILCTRVALCPPADRGVFGSSSPHCKTHPKSVT
jgi:hypothetical protein